MGMSTHVIGFKPADEKWAKMKAIWDTCEAAGIEPPIDVNKFFNYEKPDPAGVEVNIDVREWSDASRQGYEIDVKSLPPDVTVIRFYNAW